MEGSLQAPSWAMHSGTPPSRGGWSDTLQPAGEMAEQHDLGFGAAGFSEGRFRGGVEHPALLGSGVLGSSEGCGLGAPNDPGHTPLDFAHGGDASVHGGGARERQTETPWQSQGSDGQPLTFSALPFGALYLGYANYLIHLSHTNEVVRNMQPQRHPLPPDPQGPTLQSLFL